jgi:isocitrate dehydrogenase
MLAKKKIAVLPGDGVGYEVTEAALPVFEALNLPFEFAFGDIGWKFWCEEGNPVPQRTWDLIKSCDATLLGAITSLPEKEAEAALRPGLQGQGLKYLSPVIQLRQGLDLYANVRPAFNIRDSLRSFNFVVIRENTEGLYAGLDFYPLPEELKALLQKNPKWQNFDPEELSVSLRVQSKPGLLRIFRFAFEYALNNGFNRVTFADKPNVLRKSGAFARACFESIAQDYPGIKHDILNVDALALWLVRRPEEFGVVVGENMFTDILSDVGAAVMGGLGFAPSKNVGESGAYFEPVHGSAPKISPNKANPSAMFLTCSMLLSHLGFKQEAERIIAAVKQVIKADRYVTYDLGGTASTQEMARAIIDACVHFKIRKKIAFLATGSELLNGQVLESNSHYASGLITERGGVVNAKFSVSDEKKDITRSLLQLAEQQDAVITIGGLGPTSDDNTRFALSEALRLPLQFDEASFEHVKNRLNRFGLAFSEENKKQALFPQSAHIFENQLGTANACHVHFQGKDFFMLPGPPKEFKPLFEKEVLPYLEQQGYLGHVVTQSFLTLGLIEGEISLLVDEIAKQYGLSTAYRWAYPYLEIKLILEEENPEGIRAIERLLKENIVSQSGKTAEILFSETVKACSEPLFVEWLSSETHDFTYLAEAHSAIVSVKDKSTIPSNASLFSFSLEWPDKQEPSVLALRVQGQKNNVSYQHQLKTPKRESDIELFIKAYFFWQLSCFIEATHSQANKVT